MRTEVGTTGSGPGHGRCGGPWAADRVRRGRRGAAARVVGGTADGPAV